MEKPEKSEIVTAYYEKREAYRNAYNSLNTISISLSRSEAPDARLIGSDETETYRVSFTNDERLEVLRELMAERVRRSEETLRLGEELHAFYTPEVAKQVADYEEALWSYRYAVDEEKRKIREAEHEARRAEKRTKYTVGKSVWFKTGNTTWDIVERIGNGALLVERYGTRKRRVSDVLELVGNLD